MSYKPLADLDLHPNTGLIYQPWTDGLLQLARCKMKCGIFFMLTEESRFYYLCMIITILRSLYIREFPLSQWSWKKKWMQTTLV